MANPGDKVKVVTKEKEIEGILMPRPELLDKDTIVVKLSNGYNIGIDKKNIKEMKVIEKYSKKTEKKEKIRFNKELPTISILHTGGTIASKVDYRTGGVVSAFTPEDLIEMFPELKDIANIKSRLLFQMFSEDMEPEHWSLLAKEIEKEIKQGIDGIIITHGTDTLHYTSAALSFMLQDLSIPVLLVGAQRSSDRGSSDAYMNLICAAYFIAKTDFSGVAVCMHTTAEDKYCYIHQGTKVRKLHTSRRDAFKSINALPYAKVSYDGKIEFLRNDYIKKDKNRKLKLNAKFENKVAIIKLRPGFNYKEIEFYEKNGYKGIILEGTGLGQAPINLLDQYTKNHKKLLDFLKKTKLFVIMTSQCLYGRVNMNVYSTGRDLLAAGVLSSEDMLPEVAYIKLGWLLANYKKEEVKELIGKNLRGEINDRIKPQEFIQDKPFS